MIWSIFWRKRRLYTSENIQSPEFLHLGWTIRSFIAQYGSDSRNVFPKLLLTVQALQRMRYTFSSIKRGLHRNKGHTIIHDNMLAWKCGNNYRRRSNWFCFEQQKIYAVEFLPLAEVQQKPKNMEELDWNRLLKSPKSRCHAIMDSRLNCAEWKNTHNNAVTNSSLTTAHDCYLFLDNGKCKRQKICYIITYNM